MPPTPSVEVELNVLLSNDDTNTAFIPIADEATSPCEDRQPEVKAANVACTSPTTNVHQGRVKQRRASILHGMMYTPESSPASSQGELKAAEPKTPEQMAIQAVMQDDATQLTGLLDGGVKLNHQNKVGETLLDLAIQRRKNSARKVLEALGAKRGDTVRAQEAPQYT